MEIIINNSRKISAKPGVSLLQALKENNIVVPSACGGRGICGLCRLQVLEGAPDNFTQAELNHLNAAEQQAKFRLACQIKLYQAGGMAERSLRITIPDSFFNAREYQAQVIATRDLTRDIKEVRLHLRAPESIAFRSGQYIQLRIPPYGASKKSVYRAYSIASPPAENTTIELEVKRVPNGIGTTYIFEHLKKDDIIALNGPHGDFFLREGEKDIVMIAGGAGLAPMKAMIADLRDHNIKRKTRFFFGAQTPRDIFHADLMRQFERTLSDFRFIPSVAVVPPGEKWNGEKGLVTEVIGRQLDEGYGGEVYLCGSPAMIDACLNLLRLKKVSSENIFYDKFA